MDDLFPSKYIKASALEDGDMTLTIKSIGKETMKDKKGEEITKPVLSFTDYDKMLVLNVTNARAIEELYGEPDNWVGKKVTLFWAEVDSFGEITPAVRIRKQKPAADRAKVLEHYQKLYAKAAGLKVEKVEQYQVKPDSTVEEILAMGKKLREAIEAAELFAK
jgi:hypothetical protein